MTTKIRTWQIVNGKLEIVESSLVEEGKTEVYDLETWIASNPSIVGPDLIIIGRQVPTKSGPLDLLAVDKDGNLIIIELKRDTLPREALAQAIDYFYNVKFLFLRRGRPLCLPRATTEGRPYRRWPWKIRLSKPLTTT